MSKERHELVSEQFFDSTAKEASKLVQIIKEDGFSVQDLAVIGMLMQDSARYALGKEVSK